MKKVFLSCLYTIYCVSPWQAMSAKSENSQNSTQFNGDGFVATISNELLSNHNQFANILRSSSLSANTKDRLLQMAEQSVPLRSNNHSNLLLSSSLQNISRNASILDIQPQDIQVQASASQSEPPVRQSVGTATNRVQTQASASQSEPPVRQSVGTATNRVQTQASASQSEPPVRQSVGTATNRVQTQDSAAQPSALVLNNDAPRSTRANTPAPAPTPPKSSIASATTPLKDPAVQKTSSRTVTPHSDSIIRTSDKNQSSKSQSWWDFLTQKSHNWWSFVIKTGKKYGNRLHTIKRTMNKKWQGWIKSVRNKKRQLNDQTVLTNSGRKLAHNDWNRITYALKKTQKKHDELYFM